MSASGDILLVGSVPLDSVEEVMSTCATSLGGRLYAMPDGEVGERSTWIMALPHLTYDNSGDLEALRVVAPEDIKSPPSHDAELMRRSFPKYRLKPGVSETSIDLHYTEPAITSYDTFRRLRDEGVIDEDVRFMVAMPCSYDGVRLFFPVPEDRLVMSRAYERAMQAAVAEMLDHIPAEDLVIQLDYCLEVLAIIAAPGWPTEPPFEERLAELTSAEYLSSMTQFLPDEVHLGYHLCFGTWGGWPVGETDDIGPIVQMANVMVPNTPRRVDYVHLPVMPGADDAYFRPLAGLDIGDTRVFLGVELGDGVEAMCRRANIARDYVEDFGYAHYCGYGRDDPGEISTLLDDLSAGAEQLGS